MLDAVVIAAVVGLLAWSLAHAGQARFDGKAMTARATCFPLALLVVPAGTWLVRWRTGRAVAHPHLAAVLLGLPFAIDLAGNATDLYHRLTHFDDAIHALNPALMVAAIAALLDRTGVPRWSVWVMAVGIGSTGHVAWELIEYWLLVGFGANELGLTLPDTLSDLGWGLVGSLVGTASALGVSHRAPEVRVGGGTRE